MWHNCVGGLDRVGNRTGGVEGFSCLIMFMTEIEQWKRQSLSCAQLFMTPGLQPSRLPWPWNCPDKNSGVDCHFLLQGIFPMQWLNPGLLHCRNIFYCLSHQGSPINNIKFDSQAVVIYAYYVGKLRSVLEGMPKRLDHACLWEGRLETGAGVVVEFYFHRKPLHSFLFFKLKYMTKLTFTRWHFTELTGKCIFIEFIKI